MYNLPFGPPVTVRLLLLANSVALL